MSDQKTYTGEIRNTGLTLKDFASANGYDGEDLDDWLYDNYQAERMRAIYRKGKREFELKGN